MFNTPSQPQLQNVPNGVAQQARQQQGQQQGFGKYVPSEPGLSNLLTAAPSEVGFDFDQASGTFQLVDNRQKPQTPANSSPNQPQGQQQANTQPSSSPNGNADFNAYKQQVDQQFQNIGQALTRMAAYMEGLGNQRQQPQEQQQQQGQQQVELDINSNDFGTNLLSIINTALDRRDAKLREEFAPLRQTTDRMNDRIQGSDLALQYPEEFAKLMPVMTELKKSDPNKSWEKVFAEAKNLTPFLKDSTIRTDNGNNQQAQGVQPQSDQNQQLQQRANQLQTETGGIPRGVVNEEPQVRTIEDAVNKAFRDMQLG